MLYPKILFLSSMWLKLLGCNVLSFTMLLNRSNRISNGYRYSAIFVNNSDDIDDNGSEENNDDSLEGFEISDTELQHEVKKFKAQAEIDAILNDPEGPFDLETELRKVSGISPPIGKDSPEAAVETKLHKIESAMYEAAANKDFTTAQAKKTEIDQMHIDDCGRVLLKNAEFYKAFSNKDYEAMHELWLHDASAVCIHPSEKPLIGSNAVLASWRSMFSSGNDGFQKNKITPTNIRLSVKGTTASITCEEEIYTRRFVRGRKRADDKDGMELVNRMTATNILRKVDGVWYMVKHHASWHHDSDIVKKVLKNQGVITEKKLKNGKVNEISSVEGVLGIPGHEGLGGEKKKLGERKGPPVRRVFTGSLSDLLGGGLNDILKGDDEVVNYNEDEEDDEEGDDEEIIIANMMLNAEQINGGNESSHIVAVNDQGKEGHDNTNNCSKADKNDSKKSIRQNCISTLRRLSTNGVISQKHKRILLTDIITNSANGEISLIEVAFDLLCRECERDDKDAAEEDFAEQCKVFAATLQEVPI